ncbi:cysteine-rich KTR domain-containing protein [Parabacteroides distasonis]|uniref:cysteine-rich KTR domain-containing protein n=1 Tax=Parabacteroides distasonis TaxID=823 RepID=UPI00325BE235
MFIIWIIHFCNGKTRVQVFHNTVLKDFPLFCPKCKLTHIIDVEKLEIVIKNTEKQTFGDFYKLNP